MDSAYESKSLTADQIQTADATYRDLVNKTFPLEFRIGFALAYVYSLGSPRISGLLAHTGLMKNNPRKRLSDTTLLQFELIHHGLGSDIGGKISERFSEIHGRWTIRNQDYLGALATFVVPVVDVIEKYSPRTLDESELQALCDWYRELGARMGITKIPSNFQEFRNVMEEYEREAVRLNEPGQRILVSQLNLLLRWLPDAYKPAAHRLLAPPARVVWAVIVPEPMRTALGLPRLPALVQGAADALVRAIVARQHRPGHEWTPFAPGGSYPEYPTGYTLDDLGPR